MRILIAAFTVLITLCGAAYAKSHPKPKPIPAPATLVCDKPATFVIPATSSDPFKFKDPIWIESILPLIDPNDSNTAHRGIVLTPENSWISVDTFKGPLFRDKDQGLFARTSENKFGIVVTGHVCH